MHINIVDCHTQRPAGTGVEEASAVHLPQCKGWRGGRRHQEYARHFSWKGGLRIFGTQEYTVDLFKPIIHW